MSDAIVDCDGHVVIAGEKAWELQVQQEQDRVSPWVQDRMDLAYGGDGFAARFMAGCWVAEELDDPCTEHSYARDHQVLFDTMPDQELPWETAPCPTCGSVTNQYYPPGDPGDAMCFDCGAWLDETP
jgi:hypothetical protein